MAKKTAKDYDVNYKFGYSVAYGGYHSGEDRPCPYGTKLIVNKTELGLTGNSGYVLPAPTKTNPMAGSHLHISRLRRGKFINPKGTGFKLRSVLGKRPKVIATGKDDRSGKWVKVQNWQGDVFVYCHLSSIKVKAGQIVK